MTIQDFIRPELLVVAVACYLIGMAIKKSESINSKWIPLINGAFGIVLATIYILATTPMNASDILIGIFTGITQGILCAGLSTYINQIIKQSTEE